MECCKTKNEKGCCKDLDKKEIKKMENNCCETNDKSVKPRKSKIWLLGIGLIVILGLSFFLFKPTAVSYSTLESYNQPIQFYKSITCGCCDVNANYLKSKGGLDIRVSAKTDISDIKAKYGVPSELQSCHTAIIGDYFVEGHMPLEAIDKLLAEKPDIKGIALPGMPAGSPGMPGQKSGDFVIYAVNNDGTSSEFMRI